MKAVKYVQKDSSISGGGANYKAVSHDQVISVARQALVDHGIVIFPNQVSGEFLIKRDLSATPPVKMGLYSGYYEINFVNIDKGEDRITVTIEAHANDNGDKAPGKALSYAVKGAVLKVLSLETGENDESRMEEQNFDYITNEQQGVLYELMVDPATSQLNNKAQKVARAFKFQQISEIKLSKYAEILKAVS